jgi:hypothetical protein
MDAARAVHDVVRREGVRCDELVPLRSTNHGVFLLTGQAIVAKVHGSWPSAHRELALGHALAARDAPAVRPAPGLGSEVHAAGALAVTFWRYVDDRSSGRLPSRIVAEALCTLHGDLAALDDLVGDRSVDEQLHDALRALDERAFAPLLGSADRDLLQRLLRDALDDVRDVEHVIIHGSPHRMNIVGRGGAPVFLDLETVQRGPIEWDLAHLEPEVAHDTPTPHDERLLAACRVAVSAATATWCWGALDRGPDMRAHAEHHLALARAAR